MPFREELRGVYERINGVLEKQGWTCYRSDERFDTLEVVCTICKNIQESRLIVADLTGKNPNVFLEVGLSLGLEKEILFLSQNEKDIPFDMRTFRTIIYDPKNLPDLDQEIQRFLKSLRESPAAVEETLFDRKLKELRIIKTPPSEPSTEIIIGPVHREEEWLPPNEENHRLMRCSPNFLKTEKSTPRRNYFEFESTSPEIHFRVWSDGFFHYMSTIRSDENKRHYLNWIVLDIAQILFFSIRIMKRKKIDTEQMINVELAGIRGLQIDIDPSPLIHSLGYSFSEEQSFVSYRKTFTPIEDWKTFFSLLCELYLEVCRDLGMVGVTEKAIEQNVKRILGWISELRTSYPDAGLETVPLNEILGKEEFAPN